MHKIVEGKYRPSVEIFVTRQYYYQTRETHMFFIESYECMRVPLVWEYGNVYHLSNFLDFCLHF